jgi:hypothetical protein
VSRADDLEVEVVGEFDPEAVEEFVRAWAAIVYDQLADQAETNCEAPSPCGGIAP